MKHWKAAIQSEHSSITLESLNSVINDFLKMGERAQSSRGSLGTGGGSRGNLNDEVIGIKGSGNSEDRAIHHRQAYLLTKSRTRLPAVTFKCNVPPGTQHGRLP